MSGVEGLTDRPCSKNDSWQTAEAAAKETASAAIDAPFGLGLDVKQRTRAANCAAAMAIVTSYKYVSRFLYQSCQGPTVFTAPV